jgi:predicted small secreted protein
MITVRKLGVIAVSVVALTLAACGTARTVPPTTQNGGEAIVTGFAGPCVAYVQNPPSVVTVRLFSGPSLVTSVRIRSGGRYRFSVVPGPYRVEVAARSVDIAVGAGRSATADFPTCVHGTVTATSDL